MEDKTNKSQEICKETFTKLIGIEDIPKFTQICRVCLCETNENDQKLDTRILLLNNAQEIRSLLQESTGVQIVDLDFLPNHICDRCFKTLTAWYRFRSQTQRSNEILKKYVNSLDSKSLPSTDLIVHMHGEKMHVVPTQNISQIQDFQISFVKDKPEVVGFVFHCDSCTMTFTNQVGLDKHKEEHFTPSTQKSFKCEHCPKSFAFRNGLHNHMKLSHHHWTRFKYQCNICERCYNSPTSFKMHKSKPCIPVDLIDQCKIRKLDLCKEELMAVADKTIRETKTSCILCKKNFKSHEDFIDHYPKHNKDRKCPICSKDFRGFKVLERHVRMHLRAKVYACPMCSRSFYTSTAFRAHMKDHGKREWVYRCNVCEKEFFVIREFETHILKHLEANENENKALKKTKHIDMANVLEIENANIDHECNSNTAAQNCSTNELANQMETDIQNCQEPLKLVKEEFDLEKDPPNKPEEDTSIQIEMDSSIDLIDFKQEIQLEKIEIQVQSLTQFEPDVPIDHESSNQVSHLQSSDSNQFNTNAIEVRTEISVIENIVKMEKPELDNRSSEVEIADETDNDISSLSKSNDQINENQSAESIQTLLDKCKISCHVAACQTKCSTLNEMWEHLKKDHFCGRKPFKCSECLQKFNKKNAFRAHIKEYYTFKCPVCFKIKKSNSELKKHVIHTHSPDRPFKCSKCDQRFNRNLALKVHETTHNNKKEFVCSICSKDFFSNNGLYLHSKSHRDIKELQCPICSRQFSSKDRLKRHIEKTECGRTGKNLKFSLAAFKDKNKDVEEAKNDDVIDLVESEKELELEVDFEKDRPNNPQEDISIQIKMDSFIDTIDFKQQVQLLETETVETDISTENKNSKQDSQLQEVDNKRLITNESEVKTEISVLENDIVKLENTKSNNPISIEENTDETNDISALSKSNDQINENQSAEYIQTLLDKCKVNCHVAACQTKCSTLNEIWEHLKKDHFYERKPFKCSECLQKFKKKNAFRVHIKEYYKFKCPVCFKIKTSNSELKKHVILTHSPDRHLKCSKCDQRFSRPLALKVHETTHINKKEFVCSICSKDFFSNTGLYMHSKSHKDIKELQCPICSRQLSSKYRLKRHIDMTTCRRKNIKLNWGAVGEEEKSKYNNVVDDVGIQNDNNFEIGNEYYEDSERYAKNKPEKDSSYQREMNFPIEINISKQPFQSKDTDSQVHSTYQLKTDIPKDHRSSDQASQLQNADNNQFNTNAQEVKTEINVLEDDIVKLENPEMDNSSSEEDNAYETDDDISTLSKSNNPIGKNQTSEYTKKLLDKCKVNCHFSGCQTKCSTLTEIWEHLKKEHLTGKKPFKCCICFEEFEHKMSYRLHIKKYYSFKCPICFKLKVNSYELKSHVILAHSNERPFKCSKCFKQFVSSSYLKAHYISHSNKKEFVCNICSRDFFSKNGLYLHLKSHKVIKELQCSICNRQFLSKDHLRRHIEINTCSRKCTK